MSLEGLVSEWNGDWRSGGDKGDEDCGHDEDGDVDGATIASRGRRGWVRRRMGRVTLEIEAAAPSTTEPIESWRRLTLCEFLSPRPFRVDSAPEGDDADLWSRDGCLLSLLVPLKAPPP